MKTALLLPLAVLLLTALSFGCTGSQAEYFDVAEAPGIRLTAEAMEVITNSGEVYSLGYTERVA